MGVTANLAHIPSGGTAAAQKESVWFSWIFRVKDMICKEKVSLLKLSVAYEGCVYCLNEVESQSQYYG